eukprot:6190245-Pleurochrysis_carterae.AAC.2
MPCEPAALYTHRWRCVASSRAMPSASRRALVRQCRDGAAERIYGNLRLPPPCLCALAKKGWCVVTLPPSVVALPADVQPLLRRFFAEPDAVKNSFRTTQHGEVLTSHPGYLTPHPGYAELLEIRRSQCDESYRLPPHCADACCALFDALRSLAVSLLAEVSAMLCGDAGTLPRLVRHDSGPATMRAIHYDQVREGRASACAVARARERGSGAQV